MESLMVEVQWSNYRNSVSGDCHYIGGQTTKIVALGTTDKLVSLTIILPSMKYFGVSFQGYALKRERYIYIYIYIYYLLLV